LSDPKQEFDRSKRALFYRAAGKVRFVVRARVSHAHVIQNGRFSDDEAFWQEHLSSHKVRFRRKANDLGFRLYTDGDYRFFQNTMEQKLTGFHWTSAEPDDDEGENEDEEVSFEK
jgi:hypothetical protein